MENENTFQQKPLCFPYLLIGSGRISRHFQHYFRLLQIPYRVWTRKKSLEQLQKQLETTDKVLLLISDSALQVTTDELRMTFQGPIIHMSGALSISGATWVHPLMTFAETLYDLEFYQRIGFAEPTPGELTKLIPELRNPRFVIPDNLKALYHAWAVIGGNLTSLLATEALRELQNLSIPGEAAKLYLHRSIENAIESGPGSVTGPLVRRDKTTLQKNMNALDREQKKLYAAFVEKFAPEVDL